MAESIAKLIFKIRQIAFLIIFLINEIKGIEETIFTKFNDFTTISSNQEFKIKIESPSILYFDSIDKNSIVYMQSQDEDKDRIDGEFITLYPEENLEVIYTIKNELYNSNSPSIFLRYLFPEDLSNKEIDILDDNICCLYLKRYKNYTLNFENNSDKKIISLSRKTLDAELTIEKDGKTFKLNKNNLYYDISKDFKGKIKLITNEYDAFIQFLSSPEEKDEHTFIMASSSFSNYKIKFPTSTLYIPYTQKEIKIELISSEKYKYSFSGGFSSSVPYSWYYYSSKSNSLIDTKKIKEEYVVSITFYNIYKNISLLDNEYFTFTINVNYDKKKNISLNYYQTSEIDDLMDEALSEVYCNNIIKDMQEIFEIYVYTDIAKNPPKINGDPNYHHEKINIKERLSKIITKNRYFYEFYQEIELILSSVRDGHLNVFATKTPKGVSIDQYKAHLPFEFKIKEYFSNYRIYIVKIDDIFNKYDDKTKKLIENHLNTPVKYINGLDPFDFIQNWNKFRKCKNMHAQFTKTMHEISVFNLNRYPFNYTDMKFNEFEFEDDEILRISYHFDKPLKISLQFENYFLNFIKNIENSKDIPLNNIIYNNFLIFKGEKKQELKETTASQISWDISHDESNRHIKCRVDNIKKVNVIYQNSFHFDYHGEVIGKLLKCSKLFHKNNYPIIIIESNNGGGKVILYTIMLQILQPRIEFKDYRSYRITPFSEEIFKLRNLKGFIDTYDCTILNSYKDIKIYYDDSYGDPSIHHNRTSPFDPLEKIYRLALKEFREELMESSSQYLKNPTDIIIFTDSFSYSSTSGLIKGFQNTGSAVTVGFFGNPKIKGTDLFDASQSSSTVHNDFLGTSIKSRLEKNGFKINGVTIAESYKFHQKDNDIIQYPREYEFNPVDFRVDIYSDYSDDLYDKFIDEGLKIHQKLNQEQECNSKNDKLFLHDDSCSIIEGYEHAGGGFKCNESNIWDKNKCQPYYCEIGYYFDQIKKKCIENCKFENEKSIFVYGDDELQYFDLEKKFKYNFILTYLATRNYFYNITSNGQSIIKPITSYEISFDSEDFERKLEIKEIKNTKLEFENLNEKNKKYSLYESGEFLIFIEISENSVLYIDNIYKNSKTELKIAEFDSQMTYDQIVKIDSKYFSEFKDSIRTLIEGKIYLLYVKLPSIDSFTIFMNHKYSREVIEINDFDPNILYLEYLNIYLLDFKNNKNKKMLKLSRKTLNAKVKILNEAYEEVSVLQASNLYYEIYANFKGKLRVSVEDNNAMLEILFKQDDSQIDIFNLDKNVYTLNKKYNIITIPKSIKDDIKFDLWKNDEAINFNIFMAYTIPPYNFFTGGQGENNYRIKKKISFTINEHYKDDIKLMDDEYYCIMIENFGEDITLEITNINFNYSRGLKGWIISLFVALSIFA